LTLPCHPFLVPSLRPELLCGFVGHLRLSRLFNENRTSQYPLLSRKGLDNLFKLICVFLRKQRAVLLRSGAAASYSVFSPEVSFRFCSPTTAPSKISRGAPSASLLLRCSLRSFLAEESGGVPSDFGSIGAVVCQNDYLVKYNRGRCSLLFRCATLLRGFRASPPRVHSTTFEAVPKPFDSFCAAHSFRRREKRCLLYPWWPSIVISTFHARLTSLTITPGMTNRSNDHDP